VISQGKCGALSDDDCTTLRSEGVVLRAAGDGTVVDSNTISNVQSGIFLNGANNARITNNVISNVEALDGITIQGSASGFFTNSLIAGNTISHVGPIDDNASANEEDCGINEYSGTGVAQNIITGNTVNDAYCGVAAVTADLVESGHYSSTLYNVLNSDNYPDVFPPAAEPGQTTAATSQPLASRGALLAVQGSGRLRSIAAGRR
jgi:parallel beta-helix repeat protein